MNGELQGMSARCVAWLLWRNPLYLLSAALMAVGARLYLVSPTDAAGDIGLILLTLLALQAYEMAVGVILVLLHRTRRSPEDQPSLLLVAALFWTGPMAATIEMTAFRPELGTALATGAGVLALSELWLVSRRLGLRLSRSVQVQAAMCLLLLAGAPPLLKIPPSASGVNELFLYAAWWVFAAMVLLSVWTARSRRAADSPGVPPADRARLKQELAFTAIVLAASAFHLVGMNHGFYCHARLFYGGPMLVAVYVVGVEWLSAARWSKGWLVLPWAVLPGVALLAATQSFDPEVPAAWLPRWARNPLGSTLVIAALAWWYGYLRQRVPILLHVGNAAGVLAGLILARAFGEPGGASTALPDASGLSRTVVAVGLFAVTAYLAVSAIWRRSRWEGLAAATVHLAAVVVLVSDRVAYDAFIIRMAVAWTVLVGLHLAVRRPHWLPRLLSIGVLAAMPWLYDSDPLLCWAARAHAAAMVVILLAAGRLWPGTRYRTVGVTLAGVQLAFHGGRWIVQESHPEAMLIVSAGFALLIGGALVSWYKRALLEALAGREVEATATPEEP